MRAWGSREDRQAMRPRRTGTGAGPVLAAGPAPPRGSRRAGGVRETVGGTESLDRVLSTGGRTFVQALGAVPSQSPMIDSALIGDPSGPLVHLLPAC